MRVPTNNGKTSSGCESTNQNLPAPTLELRVVTVKVRVLTEGQVEVLTWKGEVLTSQNAVSDQNTGSKD